MSKLSSFLSPCLLVLFLFLRRCIADVGTAAFYAPPYIPTVCYGGETGEFPPGNLFAAAGEAIWDGGAACGRFYMVRCLSSASPRACVAGGSVRVKIVDQGSALRSPPSKNGTTIYGDVFGGVPEDSQPQGCFCQHRIHGVGPLI